MEEADIAGVHLAVDELASLDRLADRPDGKEVVTYYLNRSGLVNFWQVISLLLCLATAKYCRSHQTVFLKIRIIEHVVTTGTDPAEKVVF